MRSSINVLKDESGLGQTMSDGSDRSQVGATLGSDWHITRPIFKNHIGCGHTFAAVGGALALQQLHGFSPADRKGDPELPSSTPKRCFRLNAELDANQINDLEVSF